jgi:hypothetical protein
MHVHPPKPLHGWKEFLNEIFVIVVGVLIALGFEQVVEELHWRHKVHEGEERLKEEMRDNYAAAAERVAFTPCLYAQIDALSAQIRKDVERFPGAQSTISARMPGVPRVVFQPERPFVSQTWESLQQDGTLAHFGVRRQRMLGRLYTQLYTMRDRLGVAAQIRGELDVLGGALILTPENRLALLERLASLKSIAGQANLGAKQILLQANFTSLNAGPNDGDALIMASLEKGSLKTCRERRLPVADWRAEIANELRSAPEVYRNLDVKD